MRRVRVLVALLVTFVPGLVMAGTGGLDLLTVQPNGAVGGSGTTIVGQNWQGQGTTTSQGQVVYNARSTETMAQIAQRVYGDATMWPLIYYANQQRLAVAPAGWPNTTIPLVIPPPPQNRVFQQNGQYYVQVLPGDTFRGLSRALYGRDDLWRTLYEANKDILQSPQVAAAMAQYGSRLTLTFRVPPPTGATGTTSMPNFPNQVQGTTVPSRYQQTTPQQVDTGRMQGTGQAITQLNLRGPNDIGQREAEIILRDTGFICSRNPTFAAAMNALRRGHYGRGTTNLDATNKQRLFQLYTWYREALGRWGNYPTISERQTPQLYNQWVSEAAQQLTAVPAAQRDKLMRSLMTTESGKTQWSNYSPIISNCGAVGFGQFLPATAAGININPFDPQQNIQGIAKYLNTLIKKHGLRKGLAAYNGGGNPPASSYQYADRILSRAGMS